MTAVVVTSDGVGQCLCCCSRALGCTAFLTPHEYAPNMAAAGPAMWLWLTCWWMMSYALDIWQQSVRFKRGGVCECLSSGEPWGLPAGGHGLSSCRQYADVMHISHHNAAGPHQAGMHAYLQRSHHA